MSFLGVGYALQERIERIVADYHLFNAEGSACTPQVFLGYLPNKQTSEGEDYPCVIIRLFDGTDRSERAMGNPMPWESGIVRALIMIFSYQESARDDRQPDTGPVEKNKGWDAVLEMIFRIRTDLLRFRKLGGKYDLQLPVEWELPPEQSEPQWGGYITVTYQINVPENEDDMEVLHGESRYKSGDVTGYRGHGTVRTSNKESFFEAERFP